jgi:hypothetical protein
VSRDNEYARSLGGTRTILPSMGEDRVREVELPHWRRSLGLRAREPRRRQIQHGRGVVDAPAQAQPAGHAEALVRRRGCGKDRPERRRLPARRRLYGVLFGRGCVEEPRERPPQRPPPRRTLLREA